jgi:hypothetical protein
MNMQPKVLYNETHQSRLTAPTDYENQLADAIEKAFGQGFHDLDGLVVQLNATTVRTPEGALWTPENYVQVMAALAGK